MADVPASTPVSTGVLPEDDSSKLKRANALLRSEHQVSNPEPSTLRHLSILKDRVSDDAETVTFPLATIGIAASPVERPCLERIDLFGLIAARASHVIGPTLRNDVLFARFFRRELAIERSKVIIYLD